MYWVINNEQLHNYFHTSLKVLKFKSIKKEAKHTQTLPNNTFLSSQSQTKI
jgi:hypothetical protein